MEDDKVATAVCPRCKVRKEYGEFFNASGTRRPYCAECTILYQKERYAKRRSAKPPVLPSKHEDFRAARGIEAVCVCCGQQRVQFLALFGDEVKCYNCGYAAAKLGACPCKGEPV